MKKETNFLSIESLINLSRKNDAGGIDAVLSTLSQVSLAVLIIFIMIAILFSSKYKNQAEYWKYRSEQFARTPESQTIVNLQKQKLLLAFERVSHEYKFQLGHYAFFLTAGNQVRSVNIENIISGQKILKVFVTACQYAQSELKDRDQFHRDFTRKVLFSAQLTDDGREISPEMLDSENRIWFLNEATAITTSIYNDIIDMQDKAREALATYYQDHIEDVDSLQKDADKFILDIQAARSQAAQEALIKLFFNKVELFVESELKKQGVLLLQTASTL